MEIDGFDQEIWSFALETGTHLGAELAESGSSYSYDELGTVRSFKDLLVWQRAMSLVEAVFRLTRGWNRSDQESLGGQLRRAAVSVPSNIAEGYGRRTIPEFSNRLRIAHGSLLEVETQLLIAQRLKLGEAEGMTAALELCGRTGQLLQGLLRSLTRKLQSSQ